MSTELYANLDALLDVLEAERANKSPATAAEQDALPALTVLLTLGESALAVPLAKVLPDLLAIDVTGPRFSRLNFDLVERAIVDLPVEVLLDSAGRRLIDALGRLAQEPTAESLALALVGDGASVAGAFLLDGVTAGLNLIGATAVLPDVTQIDDLRALLATLSERGTRLLAMEGDAAAVYSTQTDSVAARASGTLLLAAFVNDAAGQPTAKLQIVQPPNEARWPR